MESQDLGKASQPAYRAGSPPYKQALRTKRMQIKSYGNLTNEIPTILQLFWAERETMGKTNLY